MKLESQVCSLELSKRLKELGFKQESLFYWYNTKGDERFYGIAYTKGSKLKNTFSAFTVAELGEMLPRNIIVKNKEYLLTMTKGYFLSYEPYYDNGFHTIEKCIIS